MGIYYQPPGPFLGGSQPYVPRKLTPPSAQVDNPPFGNQQWRQPIYYQLAIPDQYIVISIPEQSISNTDSPVPTHPAWFPWYSIVLQAWQPPPPFPMEGNRQPAQGRQAAPALLDNPPNNPNFGVAMRIQAQFSLILAAWQPPPPAPQRLVPQVRAEPPPTPPAVSPHLKVKYTIRINLN